MSMSRAWSLDDGLNLIRALQDPTRKFGYHLALGGGVLNNGKSEKDIDLYFLPLDNSKLAKPDPTGLVEWLQKMWGAAKPIGKEYEEPSLLNYDVETPTSAPSAPPSYPPPAPAPGPSLSFRATASSFRTFRGMAEPSNAMYDTGSLIIPDSTGTWFSDLIPDSVPTPNPRTNGSYSYKLQFDRKGDRIDVFVIA